MTRFSQGQYRRWRNRHTDRHPARSESDRPHPLKQRLQNEFKKRMALSAALFLASIMAVGIAGMLIASGPKRTIITTGSGFAQVDQQVAKQARLARRGQKALRAILTMPDVSVRKVEATIREVDGRTIRADASVLWSRPGEDRRRRADLRLSFRLAGTVTNFKIESPDVAVGDFTRELKEFATHSQPPTTGSS